MSQRRSLVLATVVHLLLAGLFSSAFAAPAIKICSNKVPTGIQILRVDLDSALPHVLLTPTIPSGETVSDVFTANYSPNDSQKNAVAIINASFYVNSSGQNYPWGTPVGVTYQDGVAVSFKNNKGTASGNPLHINGKVLADTLAFYYGTQGNLHAQIVPNANWSTWSASESIKDAVSGIQILAAGAPTGKASSAGVDSKKRRPRMAIAMAATNDQALYVVSVDKTYGSSKTKGGASIGALITKTQLVSTYCDDSPQVTITDIINLDGGKSATLFAATTSQTTQSAAPHPDGTFRKVPAMLAFAGPVSHKATFMRLPVFIRNMGTIETPQYTWLHANMDDKTVLLSPRNVASTSPHLRDVWAIGSYGQYFILQSAKLGTGGNDYLLSASSACALGLTKDQGSPDPATVKWQIQEQANNEFTIQSLNCTSSPWLDGTSTTGAVTLANGTSATSLWSAYPVIFWPKN